MKPRIIKNTKRQKSDDAVKFSSGSKNTGAKSPGGSRQGNAGMEDQDDGAHR